MGIYQHLNCKFIIMKTCFVLSGQVKLCEVPEEEEDATGIPNGNMDNCICYFKHNNLKELLDALSSKCDP